MTPVLAFVGAALLLVAALWRPQSVVVPRLPALRPALPGAVVGAAAEELAGDPGLVGLLAVAGGAAGALQARRRARDRATAEADAHLRHLPDALELLAAAVDGGAPLARSLAAVARHVPSPLGPALQGAAVQASQPTGPLLGAALAARHPVLRPLAAVVAQSDELGTPLAPALRMLAADERARRRAAARERAAAAAPRMMLVVGLVLAPAALLLIVGAQALALVDALAPSAQP